VGWFVSQANSYPPSSSCGVKNAKLTGTGAKDRARSETQRSAARWGAVGCIRERSSSSAAGRQLSFWSSLGSILPTSALRGGGLIRLSWGCEKVAGFHNRGTRSHRRAMVCLRPLRTSAPRPLICPDEWHSQLISSIPFIVLCGFLTAFRRPPPTDQ